MRKILMISACLLPFAAMATERPSNNNTSVSIRNTNTNANKNANVNHNSVRNSSTGGAASAGGGNASANGNVSISSSGDRVVVAPALAGMASGPCTGVGGSISGGWLTGGGGIGFTSLDDRCTARETARVLALVGLTEEAREVMLEEFRKVMGRAPSSTTTNALVLPAPTTQPTQRGSFAYNNGN